jgi:hypothetical protein
VIITPLVTRLQGAYRTKAVENIDAGTITDLFFPQQRIYTTIVNNILPSPLTSPTTIVSVPAAGGYTVGYYTLSQAGLKTDAATVAAVFVSSGDHMATSSAYTPGTISGTITTTSFNATVSFNGACSNMWSDNGIKFERWSSYRRHRQFRHSCRWTDYCN